MFPELELKEGWATVALLLIILFCVAWSLQTADWTFGLSILQPVALLGGIAGIVLAKSRVPNRTAHLLSVLAGFTWAAFLTSRVLAGAAGLSTEAAVEALERQLVHWLSILFSGDTASGNYMFLLLLAIVLWLIAYLSAWAIFRWQRVWLAVIFCGLVLMLNVSYAPDNLTGYLIVFVLFSLLLVVRTNLAFYQQEWKMAKVGYSPELVYGFLRAGLIMIVVAILLAWVAPVALASRPMQEVWDKMGEPWRKLQDQSSRIFQDLNYRNQPAFISFARTMRFGGPVELSDAPVMDIEAPTGRYWRVMVFHEYAGNGWINTDVNSIIIDENEQTLSVPDFESRRVITQTVTLRQRLGPQGTIAAAAQPLRSGLPLLAVVGDVTQEEEEGELPEVSPVVPLLGDPSVLYSRKELRAGETYQVVSSLTKANVESLQEVGDEYPVWVAPRYLQLPDSLPDRIRVLAEQITVGRETPYEKAVAIERYLRDIPYNERIEGPAPEQDGVDYFLFDAKEGYCDYYASAMVVMLRSVGVPARFVRGYSQGFKEEGVFSVLERDGHAWPEVFFPGYGWVEFEPTAGEPVLLRPRAEDDTFGGVDGMERLRDQPQPDEGIEDPFDPDLFGPFPDETPKTFLQRLGRWGGLGLALVAVVLGMVALLTIRRHRRIEGLSVAERVYVDLVNWVRRLLKISPLAHQTPNEFGASIVKVLPAGRQPVEHIVDTYVGYRFGGRAVDGDEVEDAWRDTQKALWRRWLRRQGERLSALPRRLLPMAPPKPLWHEKDAPPEQ
jgi:transglutaminase-like putative cysteine protease